MAYQILNPAQGDPARASVCALAIMAKAPRPGKVKTRLSPPLTLDQSAALNICFLKDTAENIAAVCGGGSAAGLVSYTPVGDEALFEGLLPAEFTLVAQRGNGFGERLLAAAEDILACGYGAVCLIDSDSPTVPAAAFRQAVAALAQPGAEDAIVLGASRDGGYYLIGMRQPHAAVFANIAWSTGSVYVETVAAAHAARLRIIELPLWYDVDDGATLALLTNELLTRQPPAFTSIPGYPAPETASFLRRFVVDTILDAQAAKAAP